jgi:hypothetical protein
VGLVVLLLAVVALFLGDSTLQVIAIIVLILLLMGAGAGAAWGTRSRGRVTANLYQDPSRAPTEFVADQPNPEPEYIAEAGHPSEAAWEHERRLYQKKEAREQAEADQPD